MTVQNASEIKDATRAFIERTPECIGARRAQAIVDLARELHLLNVGSPEILEGAEYANRVLNFPALPTAEIAALVAVAAGPAAGALAHIQDLINKAVAAEPDLLSAEDLQRLQKLGDAEADKMRAASDKAGLQSPADLNLDALLRPDYLVKGWVNRRTHALLFGKWNAGKTFAALHLSAHVAAGIPWFGNRVRQGGVLYIGFEGAAGIARRVHGLKVALPHLEWNDMPFRWANIAGALVREGGLSGAPGREQFDSTLEAFRADTDAFPALIVVDPLRDAIGGAEVPDRVQPYLELMRSVAKATGATVLTIHHPGHSNIERARGDSGLVASADSEIRLEWDDKRQFGKMIATKQRDSEKGYHYFARDVVNLGTDSDGDIVTTLVIREADAPGADVKLTGQPAKAWAALGALEPGRDMPVAEIQRLFQGVGLDTKQQRSRALNSLVEKGLLERDGDVVRKPIPRAEAPDFEDE